MKATSKSCASLSVPELKAMCKAHEVRGFSSMKKPELVSACCLPFTSELGATSAELGVLEKKELAGKAEAVETLKDVVKQKMLIAGAWLANFKKTQKKDFAFGPMTDRKTTVEHDPAYREPSSRYGYSPERVVDYYKATVFTNPFAVFGRFRDGRGHYFFLSGENLVACRRDDSDSVIPCVSETGRRILLEKKDKTGNLVKMEAPSGYELKKLGEDSITCMHSPKKCAVNDRYKAAVLDNFTSSLVNASSGLDELKNVIQQEKERMKSAEAASKQKQVAAKESLKGWGKL